MSIESALRDVAQFHVIADFEDIQPGQPAGFHAKKLRKRLIKEEYKEVRKARKARDMVGLAKEYADLIYVVLGSALQQVGKYRFAKAWMEVHRSNMAKSVDGKVVKRSDGKVFKPDGWTPPDLESIINGPEMNVSAHDELLMAIMAIEDNMAQVISLLNLEDNAPACTALGQMEAALREVRIGIQEGLV